MATNNSAKCDTHFDDLVRDLKERKTKAKTLDVDKVVKYLKSSAVFRTFEKQEFEFPAKS